MSGIYLSLFGDRTTKSVTKGSGFTDALVAVNFMTHCLVWLKKQKLIAETLRRNEDWPLTPETLSPQAGRGQIRDPGVVTPCGFRRHLP